MEKTYRSRCGSHYFLFRFVPVGGRIAIYCRRKPSLNGRDANPHKTHLFASGQICLRAGREPRSHARAEELARDWAEYYLRYRRTGCAET